ncbi:HalOD1 output domain-containing protein [Halobaculum lipolyticum]|uniref:HalOD1 output domain-containing protein n=1 Tax=Halobaculum lipolyticum TaxID=3032001 RepID=A0ABD5WH13_9EURY|nr:HalOD1 output domain-containing protein [Halobaculum sp. DT31]
MSVPNDDRVVIELLAPSRTDARRPVSERVVERVAAAEDRAPDELDPRLHDAVDPDALDRIVAGGTADTTVTFRFHGYVVTVAGDGTVEVAAADGE